MLLTLRRLLLLRFQFLYSKFCLHTKIHKYFIYLFFYFFNCESDRMLLIHTRDIARQLIKKNRNAAVAGGGNRNLRQS